MPRDVPSQPSPSQAGAEAAPSTKWLPHPNSHCFVSSSSNPLSFSFCPYFPPPFFFPLFLCLLTSPSQSACWDFGAQPLPSFHRVWATPNKQTVNKIPSLAHTRTYFLHYLR